MTDRELLELAAKAADYGDDWHWTNWNPLECTSDAKRLAEKLGIKATARRAIVRAAAEIGRGVQ